MTYPSALPTGMAAQKIAITRPRVSIGNRSEKTRANIRLERGQKLPFDVIKQINSEHKQQRTVRAAHRFLHTAFHRQLPIADADRLIVNDKRCLPRPPLNAHSISSAGRWY